MTTKFHVKNMVCDRCKMIVSQSLQELGVSFLDVDLGVVTLASEPSWDLGRVRTVLESKGFELITDKEEIIVERIKSELLSFVDAQMKDNEENVSVYLSKRLNRDYSFLSKLFSKKKGVSIEKYVIGLRIEKVKELIQMNVLSFSEMAYTMGYKSSSHLARQFKAVTGLSMTEYKGLRKPDRKPLDQII
ncbi:AraC family transcriptional regulator [Maribacter thermophilus]|uniref:AraC family transcriptional regulator n=1 Tax=Maribacter thermophilus TaxID=1197874 RepID=UPI0006413DE5|nr:helix-turn-helix domain-containing protein [Maribacter thermophilus]